MDLGAVVAIPLTAVKAAVGQLQSAYLTATAGDHVIVDRLIPLGFEARFLLRRLGRRDVFTH